MVRSPSPSPSSPWLSTREWKSYNCFASALGSLLSTHGLPWVASVVDAGLDFYWARADSPLADKVGVYPGTVHPRIVDAVERVYAGARVVFREHLREPAFWAVLEETRLLMVALCNLACPHIPRRDLLPSTCHYVLVESVDSESVRFHDPFLVHHGVMSRAAFARASVFRTFDGDAVVRRTVSVELDAAREDGDGRERALAAFMRQPARWSNAACDLGPDAMHSFARQVESCERPEELGRVFQPLRYVQYQRQYFPRYLTEVTELAPQLADQLRAASARAQQASDAWLRIKTLAQYAAVTRRTDCANQLAEHIRAAAALDAAIEDIIGRARAALRHEGGQQA